MKKILLLLSTIISTTYLYSQCTPNTTLDKGVSPSNFTSVCINTPVNETITLASPNQTTYNGQKVVFDSVRVMDLTNVPAGMNYTCLNNDCKTALPNAINYSCVLVSGTPTQAFNGLMTLKVKIYGRIEIVAGTNNFFPASIDSSYNIAFQVKDANSPECAPTGLNVFEKTQEKVSIYPNPVSDVTALYINASRNSNASIEIYDILGSQVVAPYKAKVSTGLNTVAIGDKLSNLTHGFYMVKVTLPETNETFLKRIIIK